MGARINDSTTLEVLVQLNTRFEAGDAIEEMVALQKEFEIFSAAHSLRHSFALLNIVPAAWPERIGWYDFLDDDLKEYQSDEPGVNGHDRVVNAIKDDLESSNPLPVYIQCHLFGDDRRVFVKRGRALIFSLQDYVIISIPTKPREQVHENAAKAASARRKARGGASHTS